MEQFKGVWQLTSRRWGLSDIAEFSCLCNGGRWPRDELHLDIGWNDHWCERRGERSRKVNGQVEDDEPTSTPAVTAGLQHLIELRKVLTSLEHADETLS